MLYEEAGKEVSDVTECLTVLPAPVLMTTTDERLINEAKVELRVNYTLDHFQVQSLLGKIKKYNN